MDHRIIQVAAVLDGAQRKKDGSISLRFVTNLELSTEEFMVIDSYRQANGWLLFKENKFQEEEIPQEDVESDIEQSQSVQIRNAIWVLYKANGFDTANKQEWNTFYRRTMQVFKSRILEQVHNLEEK